MLKEHNTSAAMYFGCRFKPYVKQGYMSGGAGNSEFQLTFLNSF